MRISYPDEAVDAGSGMKSALQITDVSRFGTFLNGSRVIKNAVTSVPTGSGITFGAMPGVTIAFSAKMYPLNVLLSSISPTAKVKVRAAIHSLGGKMFCEWTEECNLLVMSKLVVTHKVLCSLLRNLDIVTPEYLYALENYCHTENFRDPNRSSHLPPIEEKGFSDADASKFYVNPRRRFVFDDKTFIFLTASKFQRFCLLLNLTNAKSVCIAETMSLHRRFFMDFFASISDPCLLYETGSAATEHDLAYSVLKKDFNRRPILEQEIALAIIESSCETYCNATRPCPISNSERPLSCPFEYKSWDMGMPSASISNPESSLKRLRENVDDDSEATAVNELKLKRRCGQAPLLPLSTLFDNFNKDTTRRPLTLLPGTRETNTFNIAQNSSPDVEKEKDFGRHVPQSGFKSIFIKPKASVVEINLEATEDELGKDDPVLEAFGKKGCCPLIKHQVEIQTMKMMQLKNRVLSSADDDDVNVKTKVCVLVNDAVLPRKLARPRTEPPPVDFKRFTKVWPTCYEGVLGGKRRNNTGSKSPIGVTLVPFRSDSKMIAGPLKCRAEDSPSQPLNEDTALIDKLFENLRESRVDLAADFAGSCAVVWPILSAVTSRNLSIGVSESGSWHSAPFPTY
ncbi:Nibrin [Echinococcus granulosus]|uniref:Nibrin n=1 Tax=Echinococcus granulosus TaxID=6210 RepID=W6UK62_ECHGR|nr:Nibrin [Echinococcus granulosus]EUB58492.1 Nibrin [Echinococcus granulosus]